MDYWVVGVSNPQRLLRRRQRIWQSIMDIDGVETLDEMEAISDETLDVLLRDSGCKRVYEGLGWHWEHSKECDMALRRKTAGLRP